MEKLIRVTSRRLKKFYGSRAWTKASANALFFYGEECRNDSGHPGPFDVDHIVPVSEWWEGRVLLTNLQVLCIPCHIAKHRSAPDCKTCKT